MYNISKDSVLLFLTMCVCVCMSVQVYMCMMCAHACRYLQRPEPSDSPEAEISGACELPSIGARNGTATV